MLLHRYRNLKLNQCSTVITNSSILTTLSTLRYVTRIYSTLHYNTNQDRLPIVRYITRALSVHQWHYFLTNKLYLVIASETEFRCSSPPPLYHRPYIYWGPFLALYLIVSTSSKQGYQFMFRSPKQRLGRLGIIEGQGQASVLVFSIMG